MNNQGRVKFSNKANEASNQLLLKFPVSSGQQHRKNEEHYSNFIESTTPYQTVGSSSVDTKHRTVDTKNRTVLPSSTVKQNQATQSCPKKQQQSEQQSKNNDVCQRSIGKKNLSENPDSVEAVNGMHKAQNKQIWVDGKHISGQFTGSTGAKVLTPDELSAGYQAWAHQDQLLTAQPVTGGMGMALLKKMGWRPGEGLGKYKKGNVEPISFRVKLDKRGLASNEDIIDSMTKLSAGSKSSAPAVKTLEGKHPVSLLGEYCSKRKIGAPRYEEFSECGPNNKKAYLFKVIVNGVAYKPTVANINKKLAKIEAAQLCLQSIGVLQ